MRLLYCIAGGWLIGAIAAAQPAADDRGRELAATCANCHGTRGVAVAPMPSLAGLPAEALAERMREFRDGRRPATVMHQIAKGFDDGDVAAIARHFAAQPAAGSRP